MNDIFTYQNRFHGVIFKFMPVHELSYLELHNQLREIERIAFLLNIEGRKGFLMSRGEIEKFQKYLKSLLKRIEDLELENYKKKMKKVFDIYNQTSSNLTKFECEHFLRTFMEDILLRENFNNG